MWNSYVTPSEIVFQSMELRNIFYINCVSFPGVTDFKAVKDSSRSEAPAAGLSLVVVAASVGAVCLLSVTTLCIVFTYRRKVGRNLIRQRQFSVYIFNPHSLAAG